jgi:hypothetical protein
MVKTATKFTAQEVCDRTCLIAFNLSSLYYSLLAHQEQFPIIIDVFFWFFYLARRCLEKFAYQIRLQSLISEEWD